jgi:hypothetical protein
MVRLVSRAVLLVTVTVIVDQPPDPRDPLAGATVTLPAMAAGTLIDQFLTGPSTADRRKVPLTALPLVDTNTSLAGVACRMPWAGDGEVEGEGDAEGDEDDGTDDGDGDADALEGVAEGWTVPRPAGLVRLPSAVTEGVGWPGLGEACGCPDGDAPARTEAPEAPEATWEPPAILLPFATVEAWARCEPPTVVIARTAPATAAIAIVATATATRGRRRSCCHHCGAGEPIAFGNPDGPNVPAR